MLFSYEAAVKEMKRNNESGGNTTIKKTWYGWLVVDSPLSKPTCKHGSPSFTVCHYCDNEEGGMMKNISSTELAAQAWCEPITEHLELEPALACVFADMLKRQRKGSMFEFYNELCVQGLLNSKNRKQAVLIMDRLNKTCST